MAKTLVDGFLSNGLEARLITATSSNLRSRPLEHLSLTLAAAEDQYLHKARSWSTLISLSRDGKSVIRNELPASDLTIFRWMNGLLGRRFVQMHRELGNLAWGLDDMNPFTGVCHYSSSCRGFESDCSHCPAVRPAFRSKAELALERKINFSEAHHPVYVAPTDWIHTEFRRSRLGKERDSIKILNPLQERFFKYDNVSSSSSGRLRMIIVATNLDDPTKGVWEVRNELNRFLRQPKAELTMIGRYSKHLASSIPRANFKGAMDSNAVLQQMREHNMLLVPSLFENAGTVVSEAASQGIPTIARNVGGMPEMTNYGATGYLFENNEDLNGILDSLSTTDLCSRGALAKEWAQRLRPKEIAIQYAERFL